MCHFRGISSGKCTFSRFFPSLGQYLPIYQWGAMMAQAIKRKRTDWAQFRFHAKSQCEIWHAFHLRMYFQNRSAKKGGSPRTIRNYLVILRGNAGRLRLMKGAFECSQRCIKWESQPILQQHLLRTKLYVIISPIVY